MNYCNTPYIGKKNKDEYKNITFADSYNIKSSLYKYMDIESAIRFLQTTKMSYVEPSKWYDPFERRFYEADYRAIEGFVKPKLFATCFTSKIANESSWVMYSYFKNGLASKSIRFEINPLVYYDMLDSYGELANTKIFISNVNYELSEQNIKALHKQTSVYHKQYFDDFCIKKFIDLMLIKRKAFEYEKEVRVYIVPNKDSFEKLNQLDKIEINFGDCLNLFVKSIMISPNCTSLEYDIINRKIEDIVGDNIKCTRSKLYDPLNPIVVER